jgi:WD40 repeat protein
LKGIGYLDATFFQRPKQPSFGFAPSNKLFAGGAISGDRIIAQKADVLSAVASGKSKVLFGSRSPDYLRPVLSPDKRFLALSDTAQIAIVEIRTGKIVRTMELNDGQNRTLAFSPDGRKLAAKSNGRLEIWDLSTAKRLSDASFLTLASPSYGGLQWVNDQNVLLNEKFLLLCTKGTGHLFPARS